MFDFLIIDDQTFVFQLGEKEGPIFGGVSLIYNPIQEVTN